MSFKKIPLRTCIVTKEKHPKFELVRVVINKDKEIFVDKTGKLNGRGVYLKKDAQVIKKVKENKILEKVFGQTIDNSIYEELEELIK